MTTTIMWFRQDLRLDDNPALVDAAAHGDIVALYIHDEDAPGRWKLGGASKWWLHHSLVSLQKDLAAHRISLVIRKGSYQAIIKECIAQTKATRVVWNRRYDPELITVDTAIKTELEKNQIECKSFSGLLLSEPWKTLNQSAQPYKVFTPYWRARIKAGGADEAPLPLPTDLRDGSASLAKLPIEELKLLPKRDWDTEFYQHWTPGEKGARALLSEFNAAQYSDQRNRPDINGTSRLGAALHFGEISPRRIWQILSPHKHTESYLRELGWREFSYYLMFHFPNTTTECLKSEFEKLDWKKKPNAHFVKWSKGLTGYPIVDAGMRQLWRTGWMHNRVRMVVASFLVKDLMIDWRLGADWFWDTLVDADLANNTQGWQWTAGCGADAAPFFRVFNPVLQGEKFDPEGIYVRTYVPELKKLPNKWIHKPWEAPDDVLASAGLTLGGEYPKPIVDHKEARDKAMFAYERI